jgi:CoA:oxalate CoA-transferase
METQPDEHRFPLDGVRVLDLSRALSGPLAGRILSDLGAEVVKVELAGADIAQGFGRKIHGRSGLYTQLNAGKRSVALDLRTDEGSATLLRLAQVCDIVVENFRPGVLDRLGIGWPQLSAVNPALLLLSISGFGQWGPQAQRQAYAPIIHAEAGLIGRQAEISGEPPADIAFALADSLAGLHGTIALLAALRLRDQTGLGQHIDLSMFEAMLATDDYTHYSLDDDLPGRPARGEVWQATGGPIMIASDRRHTWHQLTIHAGLRDPDRRAPQQQRIAARAELIAAWIASFTDRNLLKQALTDADLAWADIRDPAAVLDQPTVTARGVVAMVDDGGGGQRPVIRMPYRFSRARAEPRGGAASTGEHTCDVLDRWLHPASGDRVTDQSSGDRVTDQ